MNLIRAITTIGSITLISRGFGFIRDILIAATLGAGAGADAFFVAFKFPNLFRRLFAEGAVAAAFVPIFSGKLRAKSTVLAQKFFDEALALLLWILLGFVILAELTMPYLMSVFVPGFLGNTEKFELTVLLTRITFPYLLFIALVSLYAGVLNSLGRFAAAAATPILLNICLIGAVLFLSNHTPSVAHALSWGVAIAGFVQLFWLVYASHRAGILIRVNFPRLTPDTWVLLRRIFPVAVGAGIYQINLVLDTIIASFLPDGSISYLFYADRIIQLPLGVVGVAIGTALLPLLSHQIQAGDEKAAISSQNLALEFSLLLTLPAAIALGVIAEPVIRILFERNEFSYDESIATAGALSIYAWGLPAYILIKVLTPGYFAREDTKTPVKISILCILVNLALNLLLMGPFLHKGIVIATVVSSWLNAILLACVLIKRRHVIFSDRLKVQVSKIIVAAALMGAVLSGTLGVYGDILPESEYGGFLLLLGLIISGVVVFVGFAQLLGAVRWGELKIMLNDGGVK